MQIIIDILPSHTADFLVQRMFRQEEVQCHAPRLFYTMLPRHLRLLLPLPLSHTNIRGHHKGKFTLMSDNWRQMLPSWILSCKLPCVFTVLFTCLSPPTFWIYIFFSVSLGAPQGQSFILFIPLSSDPSTYNCSIIWNNKWTYDLVSESGMLWPCMSHLTSQCLITSLPLTEREWLPLVPLSSMLPFWNVIS